MVDKPSGNASPEQRATRKAAGAVCAELKKGFPALRIYSPGHDIFKTFLSTINKELTAFFAAHDELVLGLTALDLTFEGETVLAGSNREDSIAHPLFLDGISRITFARDLQLEELETFMYIWYSVFHDKRSTLHSATTRFWEAELRSIRFVVSETFAEGNDPEEKKRDEHLKALMGEISGERLAGGSSGPASRPKLLQISKEDLLVLRSEALCDLTAQDLERQDLAKRAKVAGPRDEEVALLAAQITESASTAYGRALLVLTEVSTLATEGELEQLSAISERLFATLLRDGKLAELHHLLLHAREVSAMSSTGARERSALARLLASIESAELMAPIVALLDDPAAADRAEDLLASVRPESVSILIDRLGALRTANGRRRMSKIILSLRPGSDRLCAELEGAMPHVALEILWMMESFSEAESKKVRTSALSHADSGVRKAVVASLKKTDLASMKDAILPLLRDPDATVRRAVLDLCMRAHDPSAVAELAQLIESEDVELMERNTIMVALGTLGGRAAGKALRAAADSIKDPDLLRTCLLALAQADGEAAIPYLQSIQKKFFVRPKVKAACIEALHRVETRRYTPVPAAPTPVEPPPVPPPQPAPQRRAEPRERKVALEVRLLGNRFFATDINSTGAFIECATPPAEGATFTLKLSLSPGDFLITEATVVRTVLPNNAKGAAPGIGVRFDDMTDEDMGRLIAAISSAAIDDASAPVLYRRFPTPPERGAAPKTANTLVESGKDAMASDMFVQASGDLQFAQLLQPDHREAAPLSRQAEQKSKLSKGSSAFDQAMYLERTGDLQGAARAIKEAVALAPEDAQTNKKAAQYALAAGDHSAAWRYLSAARRSIGDDADIHAMLAAVYERRELPETALAEAEKATALAPDREDLKALVERLRAEIGG